MGYERIRKQIQDAVSDEASTGRLRKVLADQSRASGLAPSAGDLDKTVTFVKGYVEAIPDLLDQAAAAANAAGIGAVVQPLLDAAEQYFLEPNDLIPDVQGLAGLTDDAYLALGLISAISQRYCNEFGRQIFAFSVGDAHANMRYLLGPQIADQLDMAVMRAATTMYPSLAPTLSLQGGGTPMRLQSDPYRGLSLDNPNWQRRESSGSARPTSRVSFVYGRVRRVVFVLRERGQVPDLASLAGGG
jgi:uncharacterized membrane protein YkvA (DUF1232 family)